MAGCYFMLHDCEHMRCVKGGRVQSYARGWMAEPMSFENLPESQVKPAGVAGNQAQSV